MKFIIGLGNPGKEYEKTRHNAGFLALDFIARMPGVEVLKEEKRLDAIIKEVKLSDSNEKISLVYPQTFMNNSGIAVRKILDFYKQPINSIIVLHDEVDLPLGTIKFTESSSAAGHNGVSSIIEALGTQDFKRIRIGIESRESRDQIPTDKFVLQNFSEDELKKLPLQEIGEKSIK